MLIVNFICLIFPFLYYIVHYISNALEDHFNIGGEERDLKLK
jgi:hypothetical protein